MRVKPSAHPRGASRVMVLPAPMVAPRPIVTGATSWRVGADESVVFDHRAILVGAVVVAGDRAGADVDVAADRGVAKIGQVVGLRAVADLGGLGLDEVADVDLVCQPGSRPQARVRPDAALLSDYGAIDVGIGRKFRVAV